MKSCTGLRTPLDEAESQGMSKQTSRSNGQRRVVTPSSGAHAFQAAGLAGPQHQVVRKDPASRRASRVESALETRGDIHLGGLLWNVRGAPKRTNSSIGNDTLSVSHALDQPNRHTKLRVSDALPGNRPIGACLFPGSLAFDQPEQLAGVKDGDVESNLSAAPESALHFASGVHAKLFKSRPKKCLHLKFRGVRRFDDINRTVSHRFLERRVPRHSVSGGLFSGPIRSPVRTKNAPTNSGQGFNGQRLVCWRFAT